MAPVIPRPVNRLQAQPGDVFFTPGRGLFGAVIRLGTRSRIGHVGIVEQVLDGGFTWITNEASGRGGYIRQLRDPQKERIWLWRFDGYGERIVTASRFLLAMELRYEWGNIFRHALRALTGIRLPLRDNPDRAICSEAAAMVLDASGALPLWVPAYEISPGDLKYRLELIAHGSIADTVEAS